MFNFKARYSSVDSLEGEEMPWLKNEDSSQAFSAPRAQARSSFIAKHQLLIFILGCFIIFGLGMVTGICGTIYSYKHGFKPEHEHLTVPDIIPDSTIYNDTPFPYNPHRFDGSFFKLSEYAGNPNPKMDAAWSKWTETGNDMMPAYPALMRVSRTDFERTTAHPIETAVQFEYAMDENEGYMASVEMLHQIHCLDMIRKFIHWDYYKEHDPGWADAPLVRQHSDHCLSILLDVIWCRGDTVLVTYHWIKVKDDTPVPDFSTLHSCRDPEAILNYTREHEYIPPRALMRPEGHPVIDELF